MSTGGAAQPSGIAARHDEAIQFLGRDFDQCFSEKRRCEDQAWDVCKFAFTTLATVVGFAAGAYQYSQEKDSSLLAAAYVLLGVGFVVGVLLFLQLVQLRVYFVCVARYINEQRGFFLAAKPLGFQNYTKLYNDPRTPPYYSWKSAQTWTSHLLAFLNGLVAGTFVFLALRAHAHQLLLALLALLLTTALQVATARAYLTSREGKTVTDAVWPAADS